MIRTMLKVLLIALLMPAFSWAAGLGELKVISALGQPLRAEIAVVSESGESLTAHIASPDAFRHAGVDYNPILAHVEAVMATHPDGSRYILLSSHDIVNDPFLDILIDLSWQNGQIEREYTMLFDPVEFAKSPSVSPPVALKEKAPAVSPSAPAASPSPRAGYRTVKRGDTLSGIAMETRPEGVTLEQMLVALYQANEDAFIGKNMNLLETGRVLRVPAKVEIDSISQNHADKVIRVQTADWNAYRQRLASVAVPRGTGMKRSVSGKITASVEENKVSKPPEEVLKLSKGEASSAVTKAEEKAAQIRTMNEASERILMLEKNIQEMKKLLAIKNQALARARSSAAAPASASVFDNPVVLGALGGVVLGVAGIVLLIARKRKKEKPQPVRPADVAKPMAKAVELKEQPVGEEADPLEEAELYISYRRYAQAEEILKEVLKINPGNFEAFLMLMKIHAAGGEKEKLELEARRLQAISPPHEVWDRAMEIGSAADPENPLYGGAPGATEAAPEVRGKESLDFDLDFEPSQPNVDLQIDHAGETPVDVDVLTEEKIIEPAVDFDLSSIEEPERQAEEEGPVDFDLSAMVEEAPAKEAEEAPADFDLSAMTEEEPEKEAEEAPVDFDLSAMVEEAPEKEAEEAAPVDFDLSAMVEEEPEKEAEEAAPVDFDLSSMVEEAPEKEAEEAAPVDFDLSSMVEEAPEKEAEEAAPVDFGLASMVEEEPVKEVEEAAPVDFDLSLIAEEAPLASEKGSKTPFDLSEIPSLVEAESKPRIQELPDVDLHLGDVPNEISEPKEPNWYEVATKLDLAKVYQEMGDFEGAREILEEVMNEGDSDQKSVARAMLESLPQS